MEQLKETLINLVKELEEKDQNQINQRLNDLFSVYPFNEYEFLISSLMGCRKISLDDYYKLRSEFIERNRFLAVFEINAPRKFGEGWAQNHLREVAPGLEKPTKELDPNYLGQYDFLLNGKIRIEVKASRAVDFARKGALASKALLSTSEKRFDMNFQQVKPACCDVFIWVGVWRDKVRYWVLSSNEVVNNKYYSARQHRGNTGEGQIHLKNSNIQEFSSFEVNPNNLIESIQAAYKRQTASA